MFSFRLMYSSAVYNSRLRTPFVFEYIPFLRMPPTPLCRLQTLGRHLKQNFQAKVLYSTQSCISPTLSVSKEETLWDDPIQIRISGLHSRQTVTLIATINDVGAFRSHAVFTAREDGTVDLSRDAPETGTYTGVSPMGWIWSMVQSTTEVPGLRLMTKNASKHREIQLDLCDGKVDPRGESIPEPLHRKTITRLYMKKGVRRVLVTEEGLRGTLFVPEGEGPFPGIIDMFGGLISLNESRAALLASHGYVTLALAFMMIDHLPKHFTELKLQYFEKAAEWLSKQPFVSEDRLGVIGLSFGGSIAIKLATVCPLVKAVVNINGGEYYAADVKDMWKKYQDRTGLGRAYITHEGFIMKDIVQLDRDPFIPVWDYDTKVLILVSGDDMNVNQSQHFQFRDSWPLDRRDNLEMHFYPGAGHLIEHPYSPMFRTVSRTDKPEIQALSDATDATQMMKGSIMVFGGYPAQHAFAQENGWKRTLDFLDRTLKRKT